MKPLPVCASCVKRGYPCPAHILFDSWANLLISLPVFFLSCWARHLSRLCLLRPNTGRQCCSDNTVVPERRIVRNVTTISELKTNTMWSLLKHSNTEYAGTLFNLRCISTHFKKTWFCLHCLVVPQSEAMQMNAGWKEAKNVQVLLGLCRLMHKLWVMRKLWVMQSWKMPGLKNSDLTVRSNRAGASNGLTSLCTKLLNVLQLHWIFPGFWEVTVTFDLWHWTSKLPWSGPRLQS